MPAPRPMPATLCVIRTGELSSIRPVSTARLCCLNGWLLVTIENDRRDYTLQAGQYLALPAHRLAVLEGNARYCITPTPATSQEKHARTALPPRRA